MSALRQALADYLAVRRALGYQLARSEKLLAQFLTYLEAQGEDRLTTKTALAWAMLPAGADRSWMSTRLSVVRRFATHLRGLDLHLRVAHPRMPAEVRLESRNAPRARTTC